jgi:hypothetical protein
MRNFFEPTASPSWLRQVLTSIRAALGDIWPAPLRLKDYATAELPAAADFAQGLVWDGTLSRVSVSDGAVWTGLQPWDSTLAALAGLDAAAGILVETAADTFARRSLAAPAAGLTIANPAGTAGNPTFALANDLAALEGLAATGFAARIAADAWAQRSLTAPAAGLAISNNDGVGGNPAFALANDLSALEGLAGAGLAARTGTDAWALRTLTAPAAGIAVSNGSGAAGNPTLALANDLAAIEALSGTSTIYYRSGVDTWTAVTIGGNLSFVAGTLNGNAGTVTTIGVTTANGVSGSSSGGATPLLTITLGAIAPSSVTTGTLFSSADTRNLITLGDGSLFMMLNAISGYKFQNHTGVQGCLIDTAGVYPASSTTASAANMFQSASGTVLLRSTSSARYKRDIRDLSEAEADRVLGLRPVTYRSRAAADDGRRKHWGLIAEEVAGHVRPLVHFNAEREPESVQYERVVVGLLGVVKRLEARVSKLETARWN